MADRKYLDDVGLAEVAQHVNKRLKVVSVMPASADNDAVRLYVGATTSTYKQGAVYQFNGTDWIEISPVRTVELTQAEYDALPVVAKLNGAIYFITDANANSSVVSGYYNESDGKFYAESTYTTELDKNVNVIYIDLNTNTTYIYDLANDEYVQVGGGSGTVIKYVTTLPSSGIQDIIYGYDSAANYFETTADGFLDNDENFTKTVDTYTATYGVNIKASADGTTYKDFESLAYDSLNTEFTLTYADSTTDTITEGDPFYWQIITRSYLAGNATEQSLTVLAGSGSGNTYLPGEGIDMNGNIISTAPATSATLGGVKPDDSTTVVDANGVLSGNYEGAYNIKVEDNKISTKTFVGTLDEWNNLTATQKAKFDTVSITDDNALPNAVPGHEVLDSTDTPLPQRTNIQFEGAEATDDSTNDITKVTVTPYTAGDGIEIDNHEVSVTEDRPATFVGTTAQWNALTTAEKAEYTIVNITDDATNGAQIVVDVVQDGNLNAVTSNAVADAVAPMSAKAFKASYFDNMTNKKFLFTGGNAYPVLILLSATNVANGHGMYMWDATCGVTAIKELPSTTITFTKVDPSGTWGKMYMTTSRPVYTVVSAFAIHQINIEPVTA